MRFLPLLLLFLLVACEPHAGLGATCGRPSDCAAPLTCAFGRCRSECTLNRDCPLGAVCLLDGAGRGTCAIADDPGCGPSAPCAEGLLCVDRACVNGCSTVAECPSDARCEPASDGRARCVRGTLDDAGTGDAGVDPCLVGPECDRIVQIGVGAEVACARTFSGAVWCWGANTANQLAQPTPTTGCLEGVAQCSPVPVRISYVTPTDTRLITGAIDLAVGQYNACAIVPEDGVTDAGEVVCWGYDGGLLGDRSSDGAQARRVQLDDGTASLPRDAREVLLGQTFAISRHGPGREYGWGSDELGQLQRDRLTHEGAVEIDPFPDYAGLTLGGAHGCGRAGAGEAWCWGANDVGQAGGSTIGSLEFEEAPLQIAGIGVVQTIEAGRAHTCALVEGGNIWCWGNADLDGRTGVDALCRMGSDRLACPPAQVYRNDTYTALGATTTNAACALGEAGGIWCWGEVTAPHPGTAGAIPDRVGEVEGVLAVAIGATVGCAITSDGDVVCWGANYNGQLGRGMTGDADPEPALVVWPRG